MDAVKSNGILKSCSSKIYYFGIFVKCIQKL